jgi:tetratricopeptide (TPR) repeat protein
MRTVLGLFFQVREIAVSAILNRKRALDEPCQLAQAAAEIRLAPAEHSTAGACRRGLTGVSPHMPEYLLTGRDARGRTTTQRVDADSGDEAVRIAREELGLDEVVLHTDDAGATVGTPEQVQTLISPRDFLRFRDLPPRIAGFLVLFRLIYKKTALWMILAAGFLAYRRYLERPWAWIDWAEIAFLLSPAVLAALAQLSTGVAGRYNRLIEDVAWGRWESVLEQVDGLEGSGVLASDLAFQRANALAALGRLDEAMEVVEPYSDGEAMADWLYSGRVADVYSTARRFDDARRALEHAGELAPDNPTVLLDLARSESHRGSNPQLAREFLTRARQHALSDLLAIFAVETEGRIFLQEGRPHEAIGRLKEALEKLSAFRFASPLIGGALDIIEADLALAYAAAGDMTAAHTHAAKALPRLRARDEDLRLDRLRKALGHLPDEA